MIPTIFISLTERSWRSRQKNSMGATDTPAGVQEWDKARKIQGYGKDATVRVQRGGKPLCTLE